MTEPTIEALQRENAELRQKLRKLYDSGWEPRAGLEAKRSEALSHRISSMSTTDIALHLREVALRCIQLAREGPRTRAAQELEVASVEIADRASSLEAAFRSESRSRG
jgi:hypothetical protein